MVLNIASLFLKFSGLGLIIAAAGLWAFADVDSRPKNRDEQTLIGGAIWYQIQIPIGLIISMVVDEELYLFLHAYFLFCAFLLLSATGAILMTVEGIKLKRRHSVLTISTGRTHSEILRGSFDKTYFTIGLLSAIAAILTLADLILNIIK